MTNEEKAREIANEYCYWDDRDESGAVKVAIEMAKWKDQQFKEYLEKKKEKFYYQPKDLIGGWEKNHKLEIFNEIIDELFKEDKI